MSKTSIEDGVLFLIVGNSGSGKDTLLRWVTERWPKNLPPLLVAQRYITRPSNPETETFITVSPEEFKEMADNKAFVLEWMSYGLQYGVPYEIKTHLTQGNPVIVNVSREIIAEAHQKFLNVKIIFIYVPLEILQDRLATRGRENNSDIGLRLARARANQELPSADFVVDNSGEIEEGGQKLLNILKSVILGEV